MNSFDNKLLWAYESGNNAFEPIVKRQLNTVLGELCQMIEANVSERRLAALLKKYPCILSTLDNVPRQLVGGVAHEVQLGSEYRVDFAFGYKVGSGSYHTVLIELKEPATRLLKANGQPSAELNDAIDQVENYLDWIRQNLHYAYQRGIIGHERSTNRGILVVGRRGNLPEDRLNQVRDGLRIKVVTWDRLRDTAETALSDINGGSYKKEVQKRADSYFQQVTSQLLNPTKMSARQLLRAIQESHSKKDIAHYTSEVLVPLIPSFFIKDLVIETDDASRRLEKDQDWIKIFLQNATDQEINELQSEADKARENTEIEIRNDSLHALTSGSPHVMSCIYYGSLLLINASTTEDIKEGIALLLEAITIDTITAQRIRWHSWLIYEGSSSYIWL